MHHRRTADLPVPASERIISRASERPVQEPWIDSLAHAAGPSRALMYGERDEGRLGFDGFIDLNWSRGGL